MTHALFPVRSAVRFPTWIADRLPLWGGGPRRRPAPGLLFAPVLLTLARPAFADTRLAHYLVDLPARTAFALLFAAGALVGLVVGLALGLWFAIATLRAADSAAGQYHRRAVASVLDASSAVHAAVQDIVREANARIAALHRDLRRLKEMP